MIFSAKTVADWILWLAAQKGYRLSPMQLQKHLYYAQGYSLGMSGEKLFDDPIAAWEHGPVVAEVYHLFKNYGGNCILPPDDVKIPDDVYGVIDTVVSEKGQLSASALRNATHQETPYAGTPKNEEIDIQRLEEFFTQLFWTSDEEDSYEPTFDSQEEELAFFKNSLSQERREALHNACTL
jgi:uncharacterized phage-associated protein